LFPDLADMPAVVHRLTDVGLTVREALMIWNKGFDYRTSNTVWSFYL